MLQHRHCRRLPAWFLARASCFPHCNCHDLRGVSQTSAPPLSPRTRSLPPLSPSVHQALALAERLRTLGPPAAPHLEMLSQSVPSPNSAVLATQHSILASLVSSHLLSLSPALPLFPSFCTTAASETVQNAHWCRWCSRPDCGR